jgi:CheY-like chemotaxis protein
MAKILMIDDDPDAIEAVRIPLEAAGHEVHTARGGEEGLELLKVVMPDLIILDVMMKTFSEGFQVSLKLRDRAPDAKFAAFRDVPILMLTSVHSATGLRFGPDEDYLPVDEFLEKSVAPETLVATAEKLIKRSAQRSS